MYLQGILTDQKGDYTAKLLQAQQQNAYYSSIHMLKIPDSNKYIIIRGVFLHITFIIIPAFKAVS